jgi:hypothetical protein
MKLFSFKQIFERKKIILSSLLLLLFGGSIIDFNSLQLISIVITIILFFGLSFQNKEVTVFDNEIDKEHTNNDENLEEKYENNNNKNDEEQHLYKKHEKNNKEDEDKETEKNDKKYDDEKPKHKINIKENIKKNKEYSLNQTYTDYTENPYQTDIKNIHNKYISKEQNYNFELKVNQSLCSTPIFNLRTIKSLNFYWNFVIHNFDNKKLNNLIMCRDIHKWMDNSTLSNDDLEDDFCPIYYITKSNNSSNAEIITFEYLKIFIHTDKDGIKNAFIQKGLDYTKIEKYINELIDSEIIKDLLFNNNYFNYNLSTHDGVTQFLDGLLSLILPSESTIGDIMILDVKNNCENKTAYEFMYNTLNIDSNTFNTTI